MLRIGLTGGIGSGKSLVTRLWLRSDTPQDQRLTKYLIEVDDIARQIVEPGSPVLEEVVAAFGPAALLDSGALNRPWLRRLVFTDAAAKTRLEAIMHPVMRESILDQFAEFTAFAAKHSYPVIIMLSSPLLFEKQQDSLVDKTLVVDVPESMQISRVIARDGCDAVLVQQMMASQLSRAARLEKADCGLDNQGSVLHLARQIRQLDRKLAELFN